MHLHHPTASDNNLHETYGSRITLNYYLFNYFDTRFCVVLEFGALICPHFISRTAFQAQRFLDIKKYFDNSDMIDSGIKKYKFKSETEPDQQIDAKRADKVVADICDIT